MVAVCWPVTIIGHMMPRGIGANGCVADRSWWQAAAASGSVPPVGSHRSVQRFGCAPGAGVTTMLSETLAAASLGAADADWPGVAGVVLGLAEPVLGLAEPVERAGPPGLTVVAALPQAARATAQTAADTMEGAQERTRRKKILMVM
jgi:hypothetical protein